MHKLAWVILIEEEGREDGEKKKVVTCFSTLLLSHWCVDCKTKLSTGTSL